MSFVFLLWFVVFVPVSLCKGGKNQNVEGRVKVVRRRDEG